MTIWYTIPDVCKEKHPLMEALAMPPMEVAIMPPRLSPGDHVRIIAPSLPLARVEAEAQRRANERISQYLGLTTSFGRVESTDVETRYGDLLWAFGDDKVDAIFPVTGGFSSNDILSYCYHNPKKGEELWRTIRENPKIFIGASDISMLNNAILSQTGLITYYGNNYHGIGSPDNYMDVQYMMRQLADCLMRDSRYPFDPSKEWVDEIADATGAPQSSRFINHGPRLIKAPEHAMRVTGRIAVGCVRNLSIMSGTPYQMPLNAYRRRLLASDTVAYPEDIILFLEDTMTLSAEGFKRELNALAMQPGWERVRAIILGRIPHDHKGAFGERKLKRLGEADEEGLKNIQEIFSSLRAMNAMANVAIVATSFDIGHTLPTTIVPVGGWAGVTVGAGGKFGLEFSHTPYTGDKSEVRQVSKNR